MITMKTLIFLTIAYTALVTVGSNNEDIIFDMTESKFELLTKLTETFTEHSNVTIVASQDIYDDNGLMKEIRSIELVIPRKSSNSTDQNDNKTDDDHDDIMPTIKLMQGLIRKYSNFELSTKVGYEEFNVDGVYDKKIYLSSTEMYILNDGLQTYNETKVTDEAYIECKIEELKKLGPSYSFAVFKYDVNGKLVEKDSVCNPEGIGKYVESYEASPEIITAAIDAIAIVAFKYEEDEIPTYLALSMKEKFPNYTWHASIQPDGFFISRDVSVTVTYETLSLFGDLPNNYVVYGVKKE